MEYWRNAQGIDYNDQDENNHDLLNPFRHSNCVPKRLKCERSLTPTPENRDPVSMESGRFLILCLLHRSLSNSYC